MPLMTCELDGKAGFKFGSSGTCYVHDGSPAGIKAAKKAAVKQAVAIGGGKAPASLADLAAFAAELGDGATLEDLIELGALVGEAERELASGLDGVEALPTIDMKGVEILAVGGPYFGQGSPKAGDHFTAKYLKTLAADTAAMIGAKELRPPNKVGHSRAQKLLEASGETAIAPDEKPAAGHLHNIRFEASTGRVLADIAKVPRKLARLIKAGAYRTRSVEIQTLESQTGGGKKRVITGLAWLGEKAPAVRTLDDVVALYTAEELAPAEEHEFTVALGDVEGAPADDAEVRAALAALPDDDLDLKAGDVVWKAEEGYQYLRDAVSSLLNPTGGMSRYWVRDIAGMKALVTEYNAGDSAAYVVPFKRDDQGDLVLAPSSDWTKVEQAWVDATGTAFTAADWTRALLETIRAGALAPDDVRADIERVLAEAADTSDDMPNETKTPTLSDEQVNSFAETLGVTETDAAKKRDAVLAKFAELGLEPPKAEDPKPDPTPAPDPTPDPKPDAAALSAAEVEVLRAKADRGDRAFETQRKGRQDGAITSALKDGRLDPGKEDFWRTQFTEIDDDDRVVALLAELPVNEEFRRAYGSDLDPATPEGALLEGDAAYAAYTDAMGYSADELPSRAARAA